MDTLNVLSNLIGTIGFPCVMSILLLNRMSKQDELHKEEISKLSEALNNNTVVIEKLNEKLGGD